jgi:hypothetical protein
MIPINPNTYIQLLFKNKLKPIETGVPEQDVDRELEQELHPGHQEGTHSIIGVCLFVICLRLVGFASLAVYSSSLRKRTVEFKKSQLVSLSPNLKLTEYQRLFIYF